MCKNKNEEIFDKVAKTTEDITSMKECTGLVARGPADDSEYKNLMDIQKFDADNIKVRKK